MEVSKLKQSKFWKVLAMVFLILLNINITKAFAEITTDINISEYEQLLQNTCYYATANPINNPQIKINYQIEKNQLLFTSMSISNDGTLYAGTFAGKLYAFNQDGSIKWSKQLEKLGYSIFIAYKDGMIYATSGLGNVYAVDQNGNIKWTLNIGQGFLGSPVVDKDGSHIYIAYWDKNGDKIYSITKLGISDFQTNLDTNSPLTHIVLDPQKDILYVGSDDGKLYAIDLSIVVNFNNTMSMPGNVIWKYQVNNKISDLMVDNNSIVYFTAGNILYALKPDGSLNWKYNLPDGVPNTIATDNNTIYIGSKIDNTNLNQTTNNAKIYALANDGTLKWIYQTGDKNILRIAIDKNGNIYFTSYDSIKFKLSSITPNSTERWTISNSTWNPFIVFGIGGMDKNNLYLDLGNEISIISDKSHSAIQLWIGKNYYMKDGNKYTMDVEPFVDNNGRTIVPLRFVSYALGLSQDNISWDENTQTATINFNNKIIRFTIGKNIYTINGIAYTMDTVPISKNGRVMLPVRYVVNSLGYNISFDPQTQMITITIQQ
ncbi:MAG: trimeric autotransporter adhesin [Clostridia bacterium]|nr:trimeric autotransporter adhesin [Clostridia bacterium]